MKVYNTTARFSRRRRPGDFEHVEAEVTFAAHEETEVVEEGQDYRAIAKALMDDCKAVVHEALGIRQAAPAEQVKADIDAAKPAGKKGGKVASKAAAKKSAADAGAEMGDGPTAAEAAADTVNKKDAGEITDAEFQKFVSGMARKVGSEKIKAVIKEFGVARVLEIEQDRRVKFQEALAALEKA